MSVSLNSRLAAIGGAHTGIAGVNLFDVLDVNGNLYYWSDRKITALNVITEAPPTSATGSGARIWVPDAAATVRINWEDQYGGGDQHFGNGSVSVIFDGDGNATITYLGISSGTLYTNDFGVNGVALVGAGLNVTGPVDIPNLPDAGKELVVELFCRTTGNIYKTGPASVNVDNFKHAQLTWLDGRSGIEHWTQSDPVTTEYTPWLLTVPEFTFHRAAVTDIGSFVIQNLSGDTLARDMERKLRSSAFEGAQFAFRHYDPAAEAPWLEVHGKLTVDDTGPDTITLKGAAGINSADTDGLDKTFSESCQWDWGSPQCGSSESTECDYSYSNCQNIVRFSGCLNNYEKNFGESSANTATKQINRARRI